MNDPAPLPDGLVDEIRMRVNDRVLSSRGRVRVFLEVVNRLVPLDLEVEDLIRAR